MYLIIISPFSSIGPMLHSFFKMDEARSILKLHRQLEIWYFLHVKCTILKLKKLFFSLGLFYIIQLTQKAPSKDETNFNALHATR